MINQIRALWREDLKSICNTHDAAVLLFSSVKRSIGTLAFLLPLLFLLVVKASLLVLIFQQKELFLNYIASFFWIGLLVVGYVAVLFLRPSTERKDLRYFFMYGSRWNTCIFIVLLGLMAWRLPFSLQAPLSYSALFLILFLLDMKSKCCSVIRASYNTVRLFIGFAPSLCLLALAWMITYNTFMYVSQNVCHRIVDRIHCLGCIGVYSGWIAIFIVLVFLIALGTSFYTRTKHRYHTFFSWE